MTTQPQLHVYPVSADLRRKFERIFQERIIPVRQDRNRLLIDTNRLTPNQRDRLRGHYGLRRLHSQRPADSATVTDFLVRSADVIIGTRRNLEAALIQQSTLV